MQARYYDPNIGRFLSIDPVNISDNGNPNFFGRYHYAFNDPVNIIDPDGENPSCQDCDHKIVFSEKVSPTDGEITVKGTGEAPPGGSTYADGRFDATGQNRYRTDGSGNGRRHVGLDLAGQEGDPVNAPMDGTVIRADSNSESYGGQVVIAMRDGNYSQVAHLSEINVAVGNTVKSGQKIGEVGNTGSAKERPPHAHWEVREGPDYSAPVINPNSWKAKSHYEERYIGQ